MITHGIFGDRGQIFFFWINKNILYAKKYSGSNTYIYIYTVYIYMNIIGKKEEGRKEGRTDGRKEGRKENHIIIFIRIFT